MKHYFNDERPFPDAVIMECCDCRNTFKIEFADVYPHGPREIVHCPVCGATAKGPTPSFRLE